MELIKVLLTLEVDTETGETKCINREIINDDLETEKTTKKSTSTKKSSKKGESTTPQVTLESNKYILNSAAVELLGVEPEDRLDIKYEKQGKKMVPVIGTNESFGTKGGNKLTKGMSVSCRGKANEELSQHGDVFEVIPHPSKDGLFILKGNAELVEEIVDENVEVSDEELPTDLSIDDLAEGDLDVKEISAFDFKL